MGVSTGILTNVGECRDPHFLTDDFEPPESRSTTLFLAFWFALLSKPKSAGVVECIAIQTVLCFALQHANQEHLAEHRDPEFEAESLLLMPTYPRGLLHSDNGLPPHPSLVSLECTSLHHPAVLSCPPARLRSKYRRLRSSILRPLAILFFLRMPRGNHV